MRILLLGRNGQVGWELQRALAPLGELVAPGRAEESGLQGDLGYPETMTRTIREVAPDIIVNAAAYTAVEQAESEPERARTVNAKAPGILAREARSLGAWLVHYSTDYVFDGTGNQPWREDDPTEPLNVYGHTKLEGEKAIRDSGCAYLIFRTSWVYAARGKNFIRTILRLAMERDTLQLIDDQFGAPTGAELIADTTAQALLTALARAERAGLYHLAAAGRTTWYSYARWAIQQARDAGWPIAVADEAIAPVLTEALSVRAQRPRNSCLDCSRLEETFGLTMPDWRDGVRRALAEMDVEQPREGTL